MNASDYSIQVKGISKRYKIGTAQQRADTLRPYHQSNPTHGAEPLARGASEKPRILSGRSRRQFRRPAGAGARHHRSQRRRQEHLAQNPFARLDPTEGYGELRGRVGSLLEVGTGFHPELTGRENIFLNGAILGMTRKKSSPL